MLAPRTGEIQIDQLFDAQPDAAVWMVPVHAQPDDPGSPVIDFEARYCNRKAAAILGTTPERVVGARLAAAALLDDKSMNRIVEQCREVLATGTPVEFTYYNPTLDAYLNVQRSLVCGGILNITRDRTAEVKAELERKALEERFRLIIDTAADGILTLAAERDEHGNITDFRLRHANRRAFDVGALPAQAIGNTLLTLYPHLRGSEQFAWHCQVAETGVAKRFETTFRTPEGAEFGWFIVTLTRLDDGVVSNFVDVTQRRQYEQQIEEQNQLLRRIFASSHSGMFAARAVRDASGAITDLRMEKVNAAFSRITGLSKEEVIGNLYCSLFPSARENGLFADNCSVIESKTTIRKEIYYKGEGIQSWFDVTISPLDPDGMLATFSDISDSKQLQLELQQKVEELKRSNASLEEFAYAASHDLQEPLRKIHYFADRLRSDTPLSREQNEMFERMNSATMRMRSLIEDLLAYSRLSVAPATFNEVALNSLLQQVLQDIEASVMESGALISVDPLPVIRGDERQLRQLFQNLLSNAIKYRMPGRTPEVRVVYHQPQGNNSFRIEVCDNGIGFENEYAEKIFQVFQRLHGRKEYAGSGVGLAIARKVAVNHNGMLTATGKPEEGACFRIELPTGLLVD